MRSDIVDDEVEVEVEAEDSFKGDARYAKQVFTVLLPITLVYMFVVIALLAKNRHKQPIKARRMTFVFVSLVAISVYLCEAGFSWIMRDDHPCVFVLAFGLPMLVICHNLFIVRAWLVWFRFKSTQEKSALIPEIAHLREFSNEHEHVVYIDTPMDRSRVPSHAANGTDAAAAATAASTATDRSHTGGGVSAKESKPTSSASSDSRRNEVNGDADGDADANGDADADADADRESESVAGGESLDSMRITVRVDPATRCSVLDGLPLPPDVTSLPVDVTSPAAGAGHAAAGRDEGNGAMDVHGARVERTTASQCGTDDSAVPQPQHGTSTPKSTNGTVIEKDDVAKDASDDCPRKQPQKASRNRECDREGTENFPLSSRERESDDIHKEAADTDQSIKQIVVSSAPEAAAAELTRRLHSDAKPKPKKASTSVWYNEHSYMASDKFLWRLFFALTVPEQLIYLSPLAYSTVYEETLSMAVWCPSLQWQTWVFLFSVLIKGCVLLYAARRFDEVADGFHLKSELRMQGIWALVGTTIWIILDSMSLNQQLFPFSTAFLFPFFCGTFFISGAYPLTKIGGPKGRRRKSSVRALARHIHASAARRRRRKRKERERRRERRRRERERRASRGNFSRSEGEMSAVPSESVAPTVTSCENCERYSNDLRQFLKCPAALEEFREHLKLEFSVENLMFWEAVEHYRAAFDAAAVDENRRHAEAIAQQFLVDGAMLQVNVARSQRYPIIDRLFAHAHAHAHSSNGGGHHHHVQAEADPIDQDPVRRDIFDRPHNAVYLLMANDSFHRFKATRGEHPNAAHRVHSSNGNHIGSSSVHTRELSRMSHTVHSYRSTYTLTRPDDVTFSAVGVGVASPFTDNTASRSHANHHHTRDRDRPTASPFSNGAAGSPFSDNTFSIHSSHSNLYHTSRSSVGVGVGVAPGPIHLPHGDSTNTVHTVHSAYSPVSHPRSSHSGAYPLFPAGSGGNLVHQDNGAYSPLAHARSSATSVHNAHQIGRTLSLSNMSHTHHSAHSVNMVRAPVSSPDLEASGISSYPYAS